MNPPPPSVVLSLPLMSLCLAPADRTTVSSPQVYRFARDQSTTMELPGPLKPVRDHVIVPSFRWVSYLVMPCPIRSCRVLSNNSNRWLCHVIHTNWRKETALYC